MSLTVFFEVFELVIVDFLKRWTGDEICTKITAILEAKKQLLWTLKNDLNVVDKYEKISKIYSLVDFFKLSKFECDCLGMKRKSVNEAIEIVFFEQLNARFCEEYEAGQPIISDKEYDKFYAKINKKYPKLIKKIKKQLSTSPAVPNYPKVSYSDVNINQPLQIAPKYDGVCVVCELKGFSEKKQEWAEINIVTKNGNKIQDELYNLALKKAQENIKEWIDRKNGSNFYVTFELMWKKHTRAELVGLLNRKKAVNRSEFTEYVLNNEIILLEHGCPSLITPTEFKTVKELQASCRKFIKSKWENDGYQSDGVVISDGVNIVFVKDYVNFSKKAKAEKK